MRLVTLQSRLQTLVAAEPLLADRPVLVEDKNNLTSVLETALASVSLAIVVSPQSGTVKAGSLPRRAVWQETVEVQIHRSLVDADDVPSTIAVLDALKSRLHGALVDATAPGSEKFTCTGHELREFGDGTYARVLTVAVSDPVGPPAPSAGS